MTPTLQLALVMLVPLLVWLGTFAYLLIIDRAVRRLEHEEESRDDL
jgi:CcmD family protein